MNAYLDPRSSLVLLADGTCWTVAAEDEESRQVVDRLVLAMQLPVGVGSSGREIRVRTIGRSDGDAGEGIDPYAALADGEYAYDQYSECRRRRVVLDLEETRGWEAQVRGLLRLASVIVLGAIRNGGVMIHGCLVEWRGMGVVLAGPSGAGKSTACRRLPSTWEVRSDDASLLVTGADGAIWAHPWPTWGAFFSAEPGGTCEVRRPTPLKAICFLSQGPRIAVGRIGQGEAACLGMETIEQAAPMLTPGLSEEAKRSIRLQQFQNLCAMVTKVPAYSLWTDRSGPFWESLEAVLMGAEGAALVPSMHLLGIEV